MILIIDDDIAVQTSLSLLLKQEGIAVNCTSNPNDAKDILQKLSPEAVLLDLNFGNDTSGKEGLEFLSWFRNRFPGIPVVLITAWASVSLAVEGMKLGAFDFVSKPWNNESLLKTIDTAIELNSRSAINKNVKRDKLDEKYNFNAIVGNSPEITAILETVGRVSKTDAPVLVLGESGTGKELIAEAVHENSKRRNAPFVKVNLGGISSSLFESEMFGHKKGAYTDAYNDRTGRFALADKGTIFLDEIGDLDFSCQVKLLRVLQDKTYQILGESTTRKTDVRIVCATNKDLTDLVHQGLFREDLFYRINLITINLPSLRERNGDIPLLVKYFLKNMDEIYNTGEIVVKTKTMNWLQKRPFHGNIRELKNLVERTWLLAGKNSLEISDFEQSLEQTHNKPQTGLLPDPGTMTLEEIEKEMIVKAFEKFRGNVSQVAKALGLSRGALYRRLEKHNIPFNKIN